MLRALFVAVAILGGAVHGRQIQHHDVIARTLHRMLGEISPSPQPSRGSSSWQFDTCNVVLQDADLVVLPPREGDKDGNLGNLTAADPGACCAKCQESYKEWESANLADVNTIDGSAKQIEAIIKMEGHCFGWTFVPGTEGGNGTCYLKNILSFASYREMLAAVKSRNTTALRSVMRSNAQGRLANGYVEERPSTRGWFSGPITNPSIHSDMGYLGFQLFVNHKVTVLYSEPLPPESTSGCTDDVEKSFWICKKLLGKLKIRTPDPATTN